MLQIFISSIIIISSFIFIQINHPLSIGLILLIQTVLICLITGLFAKTFWFSYILFLIFLGGILVLFIYVTSLASNEIFSFSINLLRISLLLLIISLVIIFILDKTLFISFINNNEITSLNEIISLIKENSISLNKLYNFPTNLITILLIIYLFITLVAIVKITNIFYGPLRPIS